MSQRVSEKPLSGQADDHQPDHRQIDPRHRGGVEDLVVLAPAAIPTQPGKRPLHHPAPGKHMKAGRDDGRLGTVRYPDAADAGPPLLHHLHTPMQPVLHPGHVPAAIASVDPQVAQAARTTA